MSNLTDYAKKELALINTDGDAMQNLMDKCILEIVEKFSEQGHSGFSGSYAIGIIERLLRFLPLTPLTGEDDEWTLVYDKTYQNKRCSEVFKENGQAYWSQGKVFSDDGGESWYTNKESHVNIEFPYSVPLKPEYVILKGEITNENN